MQSNNSEIAHNIREPGMAGTGFSRLTAPAKSPSKGHPAYPGAANASCPNGGSTPSRT